MGRHRDDDRRVRTFLHDLRDSRLAGPVVIVGGAGVMFGLGLLLLHLTGRA